MTDLHDPVHTLAADHPTWQRVCHLDDLEPGWGEAALVAGHQVAVFRLASGDVYAVQHEDPVTGAHVLARGITGSRAVAATERATITSPLLKQVYDLGTGACLSDPRHRLRTFPTRLVDGWLEIAA